MLVVAELARDLQGMENKELVPPTSAREAASYIEKLAGELRILALKSKFSFLAYLLSMAEEEAKAIAQGKQPTSKRGNAPGSD